MAMNRSFKIIERYFNTAKNELIIGGMTISDILTKVSTPVYVYDIDVLRQNYFSLRNGLSEKVEIYYSMKANPSLAICAIYNDLGAGIEIGSIGELEIAGKAGCPSEKICYAGPGKRFNELKASIDQSILSINVESLREIDLIANIAQQINKKANISIRINPERNLSGSHLKMGGEATQFGIDQEIIEEAVTCILKHDILNFQGIHVYVGNQIFDVQLAIDNILNTLDIVRQVNKLLPNGPIKYVNFGGGLGIPYYKRENDFKEDLFQDKFNAVIESAIREPSLRDTRFLLELGRYLVARCGIFLTTVLYVKESRGKKFAVVDGGMNYCSIATGNLGQKIKRKFPFCVANAIDEQCTESIDIVGPLCTPMDSYGRNFKVPALQEGDVIAFFMVGAYGFSTSPHYFLNHSGCQEVAISLGNLQCIREKQNMPHLLAGQVFFGNMH